MNRRYRLVWSEALRAWLAVAAFARARGGAAFAGTLVACAILLPTGAHVAHAADPAPTALPTGGVVAVGAAGIAVSGARMDVTQTSARVVINWASFNIGAQAHVHFSQPGASAVALNRVAAGNPSAIFGKLTADGQVFLVNPSGVLFGPNASVDVGAVVASTLDIADADFMAGNHRFNRNGATGSIRNQGKLTAADGGYIALLAPEVRNEGTVVARLGTVAFAAGDAVTLDFSGDRLVQVQVDPSTVRVLIENRHIVSAPGGLVILSARAASQLVGASINNGGRIEADTLREVNGKIVLDTTGSVTNTGTLTASGKNAGEAGGRIEVTGAWVGLGGNLLADGASGGRIAVAAGNLSLADWISATGNAGEGGSIRFDVAGNVTESSTGVSNVSGTTHGGSIELIAGGAVMSSGSYFADGGNVGGRIDFTGQTLRLLSATLKATGATQGGLVRVGGGFQGGKTPDLPDDESGAKLWAFVGRWPEPPPLATARVVFVNDSTRLDVSSALGAGGTVVVWSDRTTTMLGKVLATGGSTGGAVEISSADNLRRADLFNVNAGAGGFLLLDPKNITVGDTATVSSWAYQAILGKGYAPEKNADVPAVATATNFGRGVALSADAKLLAVGTPGDAGADGLVPNSGAVHLFTFTDTSFAGGRLEASIGKGYTGGKNVDLPQLEATDQFGFSVALNAAGNRLAVGAPEDDGAGNALSGTGAAYLFGFTDSAFSGGSLKATIGYGYSGGNNFGLTLGTSDQFGHGVALNAVGDRLAVGARFDDGYNNATTNSGAVYLFSSADTGGVPFADIAHEGTVGAGYNGQGGKKDINVALDTSDYLGYAVALNAAGDRLAAGAIGDNGADNLTTDPGAVYLFSFARTGTAAAPATDFSVGKLEAVLGKGYDPATGKLNHRNVQNLDASDYFGSAVALNAAGDRLAVGAYGDDGVDNTTTTSGAVHLFGFARTGAEPSPSTDFSAGTLLATVGKGYDGGSNLDVLPLAAGDYFGVAVALNATGDRLAVGAHYDAGGTNGSAGAGAAHLFSFTDAGFGGGAQQAVVGSGYLPANGVHVAGLKSGDYFGRAVALSADAKRMAVGAHMADGTDGTVDAGAVYLFGFTDGNFGGGKLEATVGRGYAGGKNIDVANLEQSDFFGQSVALNADATRLAVGAYGDDGYNNLSTNPGAVYLFGFDDTHFSGGSLKAIIGKGYAPAATGRARDIDLPLDAADQFGLGVALNAAGDRLAVGAYADDGPTNASAANNTGAVYLFSFDNTADPAYVAGNGPFQLGTLRATLGKGYAGANDVNVNLGASDYFGYSVALNAAGNRLAVGAYGDDGYNDPKAENGTTLLYSAAGAVYLFDFADTGGVPFAGGQHRATLGKGYDPAVTLRAADIDLPGLDLDDWFGAGVALNGDGKLLAVGAVYDDGANNAMTGAGAVHLFRFADTGGLPFAGGQREATLGVGYTGGKNLDMTGLEVSDVFGYAVALNAAGDRLAVGAYGDDGPGNSAASTGGVYLFGFSDTAFSGATQLNVVGKNYRDATKDVNVPSLGAADVLGVSVALNAAGDRLAMGSYLDDGFGNVAANSGAVFLYSFTDGNFSGGSLQATVGRGYAGGKNIDMASLEASDYFGYAVALNAKGDRLAVGAIGDDGVGNASATGAVHLFGFADGNFGGGALWATLGGNYTPAATGNAKNLAVSNLASGDTFGYSVALNAAGDRLAVGAPYDDGYGNDALDSGAAYLFGFTDGNFSGGALQAIVGRGYTGGKNVNVANLDTGDYFGNSVALNAVGDRLAVGAFYDDGSGVGATSDNIGAVYLFSFDNTADPLYVPGNGPFQLGTLRATLGKGYAGGDVAVIETYDYFGRGVALNAAGDRLAVGAYGDDGYNKAPSPGNNYGAVHLFGLDANFANPALLGSLGSGYVNGKNVAVPLGGSDYFGFSVAMNAAGDRLAVGVLGDDGYNNQAPNTGAIYLYGFTDGDFSGGARQGTIGKGYTGGKNVNVAGLEPNDGFGAALATSADATLLAVGARGDGGAGNAADYSGAVRLFSFVDGSFSGANLLGTLGRGYSGGKNVDVAALAAYDYFGSAVAMNADGTRLAVGAPGDDGSKGAAYLFSFADTAFGGANLEATVAGSAANDKFGAALALNADARRLAVGAPGKDGNRGAVQLFGFDDKFANRNLLNTLDGANVAALEAGDQFGAAVALNADAKLLAVGAPLDDGANNAAPDSGAVYLFTFADTAFSTPSLRGTVGRGYAGASSFDVPGLEAGDRFGAALALNAAGNRLAVGATGDGGSGNLASYSGAVHLFGFTDTNFGGGSLYGSLGRGYLGGRNVDVAALETNDYFGAAVALSAAGDRLAVGAWGDDGAGNGGLDTGGVWLFGFTDGNWSGGTLQAPMGYGYTGGKNMDLAPLRIGDIFGFAVAVNADATRLAVGAPYDDGAAGNVANAGAVQLFSFADGNWGGGKLEATLGKDYVGGKNRHVAGLEAGDRFGNGVALNAAGDRLAVGAPYDSGTDAAGNNVATSSGSVRLFSFDDAADPGYDSAKGAFQLGKIEATLGRGYTTALANGAKNVDLGTTLTAGDYFGSSVALNAAGDRLAVGAYCDDGSGTYIANTGAVYLFGFTDGNFGGGALKATVGKNYSGGRNVNVAALEASDYFGYAVALNAAGDRLAVGAYGDDGADNATNAAGAVYLFGFADRDFNGGALKATVGRGYAGGNNVNLSALGADDWFGTAVALNGAGTLLAVGAPYDDGATDTATSAGAVYLLGFTDDAFSGGSVQATLGKGYTGGKNVDVPGLGGDMFGNGVALNAAGDRMAVGASIDDGAENLYSDAGAVYLFAATVETQPAAISDAVFGAQGGSDVSVSARAVAAQLSAGTAVSLQANNDITVASAIVANNPTGNGGAFTLQAGRSVLINANITTDNGDLTIIANDRGTATGGGVLDAFRLPGAATITQAAGTTLDAGTGAVNITLKDGAGKTNAASGSISLQGVTGGAVTVANQGLTAGSGIVFNGTVAADTLLTSADNGPLAVYATLSASGAGNSLVLVGDRLTAGSGAAFSAPNGRWLAYLDEAPTTSSFAGSIDSGNTAVWNTRYAVTPPAALAAAGNRYVFAWKPTLTVTSTSLSKAYGQDASNEVKNAYTISGVQSAVAGAFLGDDAASVYAGLPLISSAGAPASAGAGSYSVDVAAGTLALQRADYDLAFGSSGRLTVAAPPTVLVTEVKVAAAESKDSKDSAAPLKLQDTGTARLTQLAAADAQRHEARAELYNEALNVLKKNPRAADIPECGAGGGDVCIPKPAPRLASPTGETRQPLLPPTEIGKRVAVLIGNTDYEGDIPKLDTPARDVDTLGKLLASRMGFEVVTLKNASKADIVKTLKRLAETTGRDESVMVMYAGHGFQPEKNGEGYWMPVDARHDDPSRWISNRDISRMLSAIPAKQVMLLSDSCFSGSLTGGQEAAGAAASSASTAPATAPAAGAAASREDLLSRRAVMVMTSGGEEPVSDEGKNGHSVFAYHLIQQLQNTTQPTTLSQFFGSVKASVTQEFPQEPQLGAVKAAGHMDGADYLIDVRR